MPWLQPYPDQLLDEVAPREDEPDAVAVQRETIELAFLAAIQLLPPRQRAVLILRDVVEWSAKETADLLDMSVPAVNSALQRARVTMAAHRPHGRVGRPPPDVTPEEGAARALDRRTRGGRRHGPRRDAPGGRADRDAAAAVLVQRQGHVPAGPRPRAARTGEWRLVEVRANRMPAVATYLRPWDETEFQPFKIDVMRMEDGLVAEITTFDARLFPAFGLRRRRRSASRSERPDRRRPWSTGSG